MNDDRPTTAELEETYFKLLTQKTYTLHEVKFLCLDAMRFMLDAMNAGKTVEVKEFWKLKNLE